MVHQKNTQPLIFDSNVFVALFSPEDTLHKQASNFVGLIATHTVVISNLIFAEIVTVLSQKYGRAIAQEIGQYILDTPLITIMYFDTKSHQAAWDIFQSVEHKNISFVDCSTVALMQAEGITTLLTFDVTDFKKLQKQYRFKIFEETQLENFLRTD